MKLKYYFMILLVFILISCQKNEENQTFGSKNIHLFPNNVGLHTLHISLPKPGEKKEQYEQIIEHNKLTIKSTKGIEYKQPRFFNKNTLEKNATPYIKHYNFNKKADYILSNRFKQLNDDNQTMFYYKPSISLMNERAFNILSNLDYVYNKVVTKLKYQSTYAIIYTDNNSISLEYIKSVGDHFDAMYPNMHEYFGIENDTDNNNKVIIVMTDLGDALLGYFDPSDKYSAQIIDNMNSNEGDIIYINSNNISNDEGKSEVYSTVSHEFQHMLFFDSLYNFTNTYNANILKDYGLLYSNMAWLDEGLAELARFIIKTPQLDSLKSFLLFPEGYISNLSLTNWTAFNYPLSGFFCTYLYDRFGKDVIKKIYHGARQFNGIKAVEEATSMDFNNLFIDFAKALVYSNSEYQHNPIHDFKSINLQEIQNHEFKKGLMFNDRLKNYETLDTTIPPYSIRYYYWQGNVEKLEEINSENIITEIITMYN